MRTTYFAFAVILIIASFAGCYTLKSTAIPAEANTYYVGTFENRADIVVPNLAADFSELLRFKIRRESRLTLADIDADVSFSGYISEYRVTPRAVATDGAGNLSDLTMSVNVTYNMMDDEEKSWNREFSFTLPVESTVNLLQVEQSLLNSLSEQLTEDIYNAAFNNW